MVRQPNLLKKLKKVSCFKNSLKAVQNTFLEDILRIFASADVKLLCSRQEGTPNVLLEAQWLGCPVVATKAGGTVDAVMDNETGFLLDVGDVAGLEEAVLTLLFS